MVAMLLVMATQMSKTSMMVMMMSMTPTTVATARVRPQRRPRGKLAGLSSHRPWRQRLLLCVDLMIEQATPCSAAKTHEFNMEGNA